jgi:hypothetical protein
MASCAVRAGGESRCADRRPREFLALVVAAHPPGQLEVGASIIPASLAAPLVAPPREFLPPAQTPPRGEPLVPSQDAMVLHGSISFRRDHPKDERRGGGSTARRFFFGSDLAAAAGSGGSPGDITRAVASTPAGPAPDAPGAAADSQGKASRVPAAGQAAVEGWSVHGREERPLAVRRTPPCQVACLASAARKRSAPLARAFAASTARSRGGALVTSESSNSCAAAAT